MKTNWTKTVNDINRKRFTIPDGWETREQVAESLQCDPSRVAEILKPGLAGGEIERQEFPVWDEKRRMAVRVMCYRLAGEKTEPVDSGSWTLNERIRASIQRNPHSPDNKIANNFRGVTAAMVREIRNSMQ